jgi:iron complex outermembrane receptor protein
MLSKGLKMKRIYQKTALSVLTLSFCIHHGNGSSNAATMAGNEYFDMNIEELMQQTITSVAKTPQNLSDAAAAVYVITQDAIHRSGVTSIPEALRLAPGLQVARVGSSKWAITSRGFAGNFANKLLVMIDGRTVYSPVFSGVYWDAQNTLLEDIDRIEVVRGPGATVWGANAVNGVVNIITKKAGETQGGLVTLGGGSHEKFLSGLRYGSAMGDDIHGRVYLTYHNQDSFKLHENGEDANDDWESLPAGFRLDGEQAGRNSWTLQGDLYSNNENQILTPFWTEEPPYLSATSDDYKVSGWNILGRWQTELSGNSSWTVQAYYDYTNRDEIIMEQTHKTFDLDLQYQKHITKRNSFVMGLGYRLVDTNFGNTFQVSVDPANRSENLYSGFIQDEIMLVSDRFWLTVGAKWEHNEFTGHEIQPSARLLFKATERQTIWAAVSRAVRTPSQFEESGNVTMAVVPAGPESIMEFSLNGSEQYDSEELIAYEAGYRWLALSSLSFDFAFYYNDYDDLQTVGANSLQSLDKMYFENKMYGASYGVELISDWQPVDWGKFQFGYTYIGYDLNVDAASFSFNFDELTANSSPKHQFSLQASINLNRDIYCNLLARYVGKLKISQDLPSDGVQVDSYLTFDANVSWNIQENIELTLVGKNLLNSSHLEYISEMYTAPIDIDRSVYAKLSYRF